MARRVPGRGYRVVGMVRRASTESFDRIAHLRDRLELRQADLLDQLSLITLMKDVQPDEIYNLAAQSFVPTGESRLQRRIEPWYYSTDSRKMLSHVRATLEATKTVSGVRE